MALDWLSKNDRAEALALLDDLFLEKKKDDLEDDLLAAKLRRAWKRTWTMQLNKVTKVLQDMPPETHAGVLEEIKAALMSRLGPDFAADEGVVKIVDKAVRKAYAKSKAQWLGGKITADAKKIAVDNRAIKCIRDNACYWIGEFYGGQISGEVATTLEEALTLGLDSSALAEHLKQNVGRVLGDSHYEYWDVAASSMLVRARAFGNVFGLEQAQVKEYEIFAMLDEATCRICREMDGRRFEVAAAAATCRRVMEMTDPEEVKAALPWLRHPPVGISSKRLAAAGKMLPPFHARCRCDVVIHEEKSEKTDATAKKEVAKTFPKDKKNEVVSVDQDMRIALVRSRALPLQGLPNWKYDLMDPREDGIIKERRIYDAFGRVETEIHFTDHGNPAQHERPHVHRSVYYSNDEPAKHSGTLDKSLISWEREVVANMPQEMLDRGGNWTWKKVKSMLSAAGKLLKKI